MRTFTLLVILCVAPPAAGIRKRRSVHSVAENQNSSWWGGSFNCDVLGSVRAGNKSFQELTKWVCTAWPPAFGNFPVNETRKFADLLELAFGKGGVWDDMKQIWGMRRSRRFCWRNETIREVYPPESNMKCQMESENGTCYGHCPRGYKQSLLLGRFRPVCTTVCADTFHTTPCGFGCSTSKVTCFQSLIDQVGTVVREVTKVAGFITGNVALAAVVDKVLTIVEFMAEVLPKILIAVKNVYKYVDKGMKELAFFMLLFQFVSEVYPHGYNQKEMWDLKAKLTPVMEWILEVVSGDLGNIIDLSKIRDTILNHGNDILDSIQIITKAFDYPKCGEMQRATVFTLENVGNEELVGPWVKFYEVNQRPRYTLSSDNDFRMEYSKGRKQWQILGKKNWLGMRDTLYANKVENADYPKLGWTRDKGLMPVPEPLPAQFTCGALDQLVVNGRGFGSLAGVICHVWPESLGPFPIQDERKAFDILEAAFADGGLWDQIDDIAKSRRERPDFCWRKESSRPVLASGSGCKLVSEGVCYGECPWGYKSRTLIGRFAPVCTSACGESKYGFPCGFGCASGLGSCINNIADQVGELTRFMGDVAELAFNSSSIGDVVEKVTYIAEFFLQVLPTLVEKAKAFWAGVREDESEVALVIVLMQYIKESGIEFEALFENLGVIMEFIQKLIHSNFQWGEANMDAIKDIFKGATNSLIDALVAVTQNFLYKRCDPAKSDVVFAIDAAGTENVMGLWIQKGSSNGKPFYKSRTNGDISLEWHDNSWQIRHAGWFTKTTVYRADGDSAMPPVEGWAAVNGTAPMPEFIPLKDGVLQPEQ